MKLTIENVIIPAYLTDFTTPLCSTVHMCGSTIKLTVTSVAVAYMFGEPITFGLFMQFALMQAIAAVASPGVMGGVLRASVGLLGTVLGFSDTMTTLMMTIYLALDGYGPFECTCYPLTESYQITLQGS